MISAWVWVMVFGVGAPPWVGWFLMAPLASERMIWRPNELLFWSMLIISWLFKWEFPDCLFVVAATNVYSVFFEATLWGIM